MILSISVRWWARAARHSPSTMGFSTSCAERSRGLIGIGQRRPGDFDQLAVLLNPLWPTAGVLDGVRPPLGRAPPIAPGDLAAAGQGLGDAQLSPRHDPNRVPQNAPLSLG